MNLKHMLLEKMRTGFSMLANSIHKRQSLVQKLFLKMHTISIYREKLSVMFI
jgi:hypothetical protein